MPKQMAKRNGQFLHFPFFFIKEARRKLNSGASIVIIRSGSHAILYLCLSQNFKIGKKLIKISFIPITESNEKLNRF